MKIHEQVLKAYGCQNCIWRSFGQCPHGLTLDSPSSRFKKDGYCKELAQFLFSLAEGEDSISAVKEKFMLYTQEMQAMSDQMDYRRAEEELKKLQALPAPKDSVEMKARETKDAELRMTLMSYRMWWTRLTEQITKGLARIADRERKSFDNAASPKMTVQQLNILINDSAKKLQKYEDKGDDQ